MHRRVSWTATHGSSINQSGPVTYGTSTGPFTFLMTDALATTEAHPEDYVLLGGRGDFEIAAVLRKDNMQPAPDDVARVLWCLRS